jgi:hypothetical protein
MKKYAGLAAATLLLTFAAVAASAQTFQVQPWTYNPDNTCDVQSVWQNGALYLSKPCPTATNASAGADIISPLEGGSITDLTELNFDVENGGHCGAGAPRYNVVVNGQTYFLGCASGTHTDLGNGWTHVVFGPADFAAAGIPTTGTLDDIYLVFDEGTDTAGGTPGEVVLDNFSVNGTVVGGPAQPATADDCKNGGWMNFSSPAFRNQGQCVSWVVSNRGGNSSTHRRAGNH